MNRTKIDTGDRPTPYPADHPLRPNRITRMLERLVDIPLMLMVLLLGIPLLLYCVLSGP